MHNALVLTAWTIVMMSSGEVQAAPPSPAPGGVAQEKAPTSDAPGVSNLERDEGPSSIPRRVAGLGLVVSGGGLVALGLVLGSGSVVYFLLSHHPSAPSVIRGTPLLHAGVGLAAMADAMGVWGVLLGLGGLVVAAWP